MLSVIHYATILTSVFKESDVYINMDTNREIVSRLKFISKIQKDEKINTRYMFIQPDHIITRLSRTFYNKDNRNNTLKFVKTTIERSFELLSLYKAEESKNKEINNRMIENIIKDIKNSITGIINLKHTYSDDIKFGCDMDTVIQSIEAKLAFIFSKKNESDKIINDMEKTLSTSSALSDKNELL